MKHDLEFYKNLAFGFFMLHTNFPVEIDFKNGVTAWGVDEGEVRGREWYAELMKEAEEVFIP